MNKNKIYELLSEGNVTDAVSVLLEELEGPELDNEAKELENVATDENKPEVTAEKVDNQDVYSADEHKEAEEVKEVVVESDQVAAGPELKEPKELENEATEEREPKEDDLEKDNQDVYCDKVHDETEDVKEVVVENATLDEMFDYLGTLESEDEIEYIVENVLNDAEYDMFTENLDEGFGNWVRRTFNGDNKAISNYVKAKKKADIYDAAKSKKKLKQLNKDAKADKKAYEKGLKAHLKTVNTKGMSKADKANAVKNATDAYNKGAGAKSHSTMINSANARNAAQTTHDNNYSKKAYKDMTSKLKQKSDENYTKKVQQERDNKLKAKQDILKNKGLLEATDFELLNWLNENEYEPTLGNLAILKEMLEKADNVATEEKTPETMEQNKDNQDVYPTDEHKETEEVKEVVVEDSVAEDILDSNPEAEKAEETFETPEQVAPTASETAEEVEKLLDVNPAEAPKDVELSESMKAIFSILDRINESAQVAAGPELKEPKELENEATEENKPEASAEEKDNQDVYPTDEHKETEEVKEVVVESDQVAAGPELKEPKDLENEATKEKTPETMEQTIDNKDVYDAPEHKEVEEVVEVVVEAAKLCSENGVPATLDNITKYAKTLFESENIALNVGVPADKEYDADADIESSEMNGNKEEFEKYEDIQGDGAEAAKAEESVVESNDLHETVKYTSLREACLLDEDYFVNDSYTIQTADEKQAKLTEQISLLLAREAMDPLYDELLRASTRAQRLQEACKNKYKAKAEVKAKNIVDNNKKKS